MNVDSQSFTPGCAWRSWLFILLFVLSNSCLLLLYPFSLERFLFCAATFGSGTILMLYLLFHPQSQFLVTNRSRVNRGGARCAALTFDDGPNNQHTEAILRILRERRVRATFFVVGKAVRAHPELARRIIDEGHELASHTFSHPALFCFLSPSRLKNELEESQKAIAEACAVSPRYFRSPVGLKHPLLQQCLREARMEYISWRVRGFDSIARDPMALQKRIADNTRSGDIILLHDRPGKPTECMLQALPAIIDNLRNRGFDLVPI